MRWISGRRRLPALRAARMTALRCLFSRGGRSDVIADMAVVGLFARNPHLIDPLAQFLDCESVVAVCIEQRLDRALYPARPSAHKRYPHA